jgi:hypothetical protein
LRGTDGLTSHLLDPGSKRNLKIHFVMLSGRTGIFMLAVVTVGFVAAELLTLIVLATDTPAFTVFVMVILFVFAFAWFVGLQALNPLLQSAAARSGWAGTARRSTVPAGRRRRRTAAAAAAAGIQRAVSTCLRGGRARRLD